MTLFRRGSYTLASGMEARWKIECDVLTTSDWKGLAIMAIERFGLPGDVVGVPRGGIPFAEALKPYRCGASGPLWIVDDVVTTGGSLGRQLASLDGFLEASPDRMPLGLAVFSRGVRPAWIEAIFTMG